MENELQKFEDEDGGRVRIEPQIDLPIKPSQVVTTDLQPLATDKFRLWLRLHGQN